MVHFSVLALNKLGFEVDAYGLNIDAEKFYQFLKQNRTNQDSKIIKKQNILREISTFKDGLFEDDGVKKLRVTSVFRYLFSHFDDYEICQELCQDIICHSTGNQTKEKQDSKTNLSLYQELISSCIIYHNEQSAKIQDSELEYIQLNHKDLFTDSEWNQIKLFEWNFQNYTSVREGTRYETLLEKKFKFYELCTTTVASAVALQPVCEKAIRTNLARKAVSDVTLNGILVTANSKHRPELIEIEVRNVVKTSFGIELIRNVLCIGCSKNCSHKAGIHLILELSANVDLSIIHDISTLLSNYIQRTHFEFVREMHFLKEGSIETKADGFPPRFCTRDLIQNRKINDKIVHSILSKGNENDDSLGSQESCLHGTFCTACFNEYEKHLNYPLNVYSFDITKEWTIFMPLPLRLFFENIFVKKDTTHETKVSKLSSLYCLTEALFNIKNKHYHGITQDVNTDELLIHYHNVSSVFEVTSHVGLTQSQRTGDRRLKYNADPELCYYQTYLRQYSLSYKAVHDSVECKHDVSLQQCHLALLMDNLVHLTIKTDPLPGESRTNQICTLPLTIKGIPKDSCLVESWHGEDCDGSEHCICKNQDKLSKTDINTVFLDLNDDEKKIYKTFKRESLWTIGHIWNKMEIINLIDKDPTKPGNITSANAAGEELNKTFESLTLETSIDMAEADPLTDVDKSMESLSLNEDEEELVDKSMESLSLNEDEEELVNIIHETGESDSDGELSLPEMPSPNLSMIESDSDTISLEDYELQLEDDTENILEIEMLLRAVNNSDSQKGTESDDTQRPEKASSGENNQLEESENNHESVETTSVGDGDGNSPFRIFLPRPILTRHPPPASGRDDDINVLRSVLDDILLKLEISKTNERVLFAPDFKIANNLFKLMDSNPKYQAFLPEFPVLHLRKSKITNLISAYKDSGLIHILQYMKDDENEKDWAKLLTIANIETATRNIWRLSTAIHVTLCIAFLKSLPNNEAQTLLRLFESSSSTQTFDDQFGNKIEDFIKVSCEQNATFCLHHEIMIHCDEIVAIGISERIGGTDGHNLLLASVKSSLPFSFLNGASSYAGFCSRLLLEHYQAGLFHKNFKQSMYTLPYDDSIVNFGLDTLREIDHRSAKKCIRPGSTLETLLPKMSTVDKQKQLHAVRKSIVCGKTVGDDDIDKVDNKAVKSSASKYLGKKLSASDKEHIERTIKLMLRQNAFHTEKDLIPRNIYHSNLPEVSTVILDKNTYDVGRYLIKRFACDKKYLDLTQEDYPSLEDMNGPKELISRVKRNQSVTIKRTTCKPKNKPKTDRDREEKQRTAKVKKLSKVIDCMSSSKNTCQAVLKPDGSKNMTNKSAGVKKALINLIKRCLQSDTATNPKLDSSNTELNNLILTDFTTLPLAIQQSGVISIVEFAGTKFKVFATSGQQYLNYISNGIVKKLLNYLPNLERIIICEEKYAFTPNDFKANTRQKRKQKEKVTISHLKEDQEIVSSENFSKQAVVGTMAGKILISRYLATQMEHLKIKADLEINVDSEAYTSKCNCQKEHDESCSRYTIPVRVMYNKQTGYVKEGFIDEVKQRKGEAEMAQADWLLDADIQKSLGNSKCVVNYVTSADIDTVVIHILAVSQFWPRNEDNTFKYPVYLILQKKKPELFNITGLLTLFEKTYNRNIGLTIACVLSMGGNDFLPNFHGISHDSLLSEVLKDEDLRNNLVTVSRDEHQLHLSKRFLLNTNMYICLYKRMYCPSNLKNELLLLEEIRQLTIKPPDKDFKHPQNWMPPKTALQQLGKLVQCQLDYFETIGHHEASLPNFISKGCLSKLDDGSIQIELGSDAFIQDQKSLITIEENTLKEKLRQCQQSDNKKSRATKRRLLDTPQKGKSGKRVQTQSTPRKLKTTD